MDQSLLKSKSTNATNACHTDATFWQTASQYQALFVPILSRAQNLRRRKKSLWETITGGKDKKVMSNIYDKNAFYIRFAALLPFSNSKARLTCCRLYFFPERCAHNALENEKK